MLFDSIQYLCFLPVVVVGYFLLPHRWRWCLLLVASYVFYMAYEPLYALLLLGSTTLDYWAALQMESVDKVKRRWYLRLSLLGNLGTLVLFKYLGFFSAIIQTLAEGVGIHFVSVSLELLLPLGISFYTFQSLGYTIDVYRGDRQAEHNFGMLALYVSFFPQLIAGPIERSTVLLPQFYKRQDFVWENVLSGLKLILWGLFKKIALADLIGHYVNVAYSEPSEIHGFSWAVVGAGFTLQVLLDFGAYTDIAIGSAKIFGIDLSINFNQPFRATNMREFWSRWHISLTTWFFEYLYKPMARTFRLGWQFNILIFMLLIGFWHGPSWGFLVFGLLHGLYYIVSDYLPVFESSRNRTLDILLRGVSMAGVFIGVSISTYFFRADTLNTAFYALSEAWHGIYRLNFSCSDLDIAYVDFGLILVNLALFITIQNLPVHDPKQPFSSISSIWIRWGVYYFMILMILSLSHAAPLDFIYFHF